MPNAQCPMPNAQCPMPNAQFPMPNSQFPIPNSQFPIPNSQFPIPNSQCPIRAYLAVAGATTAVTFTFLTPLISLAKGSILARSFSFGTVPPTVTSPSFASTVN